MSRITVVFTSAAFIAAACAVACTTTTTEAPAPSVTDDDAGTNDTNDAAPPAAEKDAGADKADVAPPPAACPVDGYSGGGSTMSACSIRAEKGEVVMEATSKDDGNGKPGEMRGLPSIYFQTVSNETKWDVHVKVTSLTGANGAGVHFLPWADLDERDARITLGADGKPVGSIDCGQDPNDAFKRITKEGIAITDLSNVVLGSTRDGDALTIRIEHDGTIDSMKCPDLVRPRTYPKLEVEIFDSYSSTPGLVRATIDDFATDNPLCLSTFDAPLEHGDYTCGEQRRARLRGGPSGRASSAVGPQKLTDRGDADGAIRARYRVMR